jgi:hypothetical protein
MVARRKARQMKQKRHQPGGFGGSSDRGLLLSKPASVRKPELEPEPEPEPEPEAMPEPEPEPEPAPATAPAPDTVLPPMPELAASSDSEPSVEEQQAAAKIQAAERGRQEREHLAEQHAAATKIQAMERGRQERLHISEQQGGEDEEADVQGLAFEEDPANLPPIQILDNQMIIDHPEGDAEASVPHHLAAPATPPLREAMSAQPATPPGMLLP